MAKQPKTYIAPHAVYTGGKLYNAGEPFTTADKAGKEWDPIDKGEKAAIEASQPGVPADPPLEKLSVEALEAIAVAKHVNPTGLSKADLITAIKAANDPTK
jgi:hypothetical protein